MLTKGSNAVEVSHTKRSTRIIIWIIAIVMAGGFIGTYFLAVMANNDQRAEAERQKADQLAEATKPTGTVDTTAYKPKGDVTKLEKIDLKIGDGEVAKPGDLITVHYKGTLAATGQKFDSSYDSGEPIELALDGVIDGWQEGIPGMKVGGKRRLVIPSDLGYGAVGSSGIPPNSDLVFEVELLGVKPPAKTEQ
jgi:FKBP-type peptidyl-prolyl cis-trans isomerase FkpA